VINNHHPPCYTQGSTQYKNTHMQLETYHVKISCMWSCQCICSADVE